MDSVVKAICWLVQLLGGLLWKNGKMVYSQSPEGHHQTKRCRRYLAVAVAVLEDLKLLENERCFTVTEVNREYTDMKFGAKNIFLRRSGP